VTCSLGSSLRRACALLNVSRSGVRYVKTKAATDAAGIARVKELALQYPRDDYRRIHVFMGRDGFEMSNGRTWRQFGF